MKKIIRISNLPTKNFNAGKHVESILKIKNYYQLNISDKRLGNVNFKQKHFKNLTLDLNKNILCNYYELYKLTKNIKIDIISIHQYKYFLFPFLFKNVKKTYHFHGKDKILLKFRIFRYLLKKYDKVFSVSPLNYDNYTQIENYIPEELLDFSKKHKINKNKYQICFIGRIDKNKNLELLLKSQKFYDNKITLKIVGDGPLYETLKSKYKSNNIKFLGRLSYYETLKIISESKTLILTSFSEGHPKVYIEAKFLKCNFISINHEFINTKIKSNFIINDLYNPLELAELINNSVKNKYIDDDDLKSEVRTTINYQNEYDKL